MPISEPVSASKSAESGLPAKFAISSELHRAVEFVGYVAGGYYRTLDGVEDGEDAVRRECRDELAAVSAFAVHIPVLPSSREMPIGIGL